MQKLIWLLPLLSLLLFFGCGPRVSREDLGEVLNELPTVPGAKVPYDMSDQLGPPLPQDPTMEPPL